jgi:hypothetical protein
VFHSAEDRKRVELLVTTLAKLYVVVALSAESCPLCRREYEHDPDCPTALAWSLLDKEQRNEARRAIKALAFQLGYDDTSHDSLVH